MVFRFTLAVTMIALMACVSNAQNAVQNPAPQANQQIVRPVQLPQQTAPRATPIPGHGALTQNRQPQWDASSLIGSGLPGAQKDGCNCFQLPDINRTPPYDPYASANYWNLCPPCSQARPKATCAQPAFDFNRFIPRPTGARLFGR